MPSIEDPNPHIFPRVAEVSSRLDEQHVTTTELLGFLIHPNIPLTSPTLKIADMATGTGIWLTDVAKTLPSSCSFVGYDVSSSCFPSKSSLPKNVTFKVQDMLLPFPEEDLGTFDLVAIRFVSAATTRSEWIRAVDSILTLLKPGGYLQWIDSCNFNLYNRVAGASRRANQEIYNALDAFKKKDELVIGMMIREPHPLHREKILEQRGMYEVHEDVFSSDKIPERREVGTKNMIMCWKQYLEDLARMEGTGWTQERAEKVCAAALKEAEAGVYHTLDQVVMIGRKC